MSSVNRWCLALLVLVPACRTTPDAGPSAVRAALDRTLAHHADLAIRKDIDGLMGDYTADAIVRSNHVEPLRGQPAIRQFISQVLGAVTIRTLSYNTEELAIYGDSVWHIGTYSMTFVPSGGSEMAERGSFFALWVRDESGKWRIHRDILNSSLPLGSSANQ